MKNRKFLVSMTALVAAVATQQVSASVTNENDKLEQVVSSQSVEVSKSQNPFEFVLKRGEVTQSMSYHSSHSSHASHRSHYSSR